jgi:hypothetical protein
VSTSLEQFTHPHKQGNNPSTFAHSLLSQSVRQRGKFCRVGVGHSYAQLDDNASSTGHDLPPRLTPCLT